MKNKKTRKTDTSFEQNDLYVFIPSILLTRQYSTGFLDEDEFRILFYFNLKNNFTTGTSIYGHNSLREGLYSKISLKKYKIKMRSLEAKGLISTKPRNSKETYTSLMLPPLIDTDTGEIFKTGVKKAIINIENRKEDVIAVPIQAFETLLNVNNNLSSTHIRLMIKLYRYCKGSDGIDINVLRIDNENVFIHDRVLYDLAINKKQCEYLLDELKNVELFEWQAKDAYEEQLDHERKLRLIPEKTDGSYEVMVAMPTYVVDWNYLYSTYYEGSDTGECEMNWEDIIHGE